VGRGTVNAKGIPRWTIDVNKRTVFVSPPLRIVVAMRLWEPPWRREKLASSQPGIAASVSTVQARQST